MGCRVAVDAAKLCASQPRGLVGDNLGINHLGNVASDGIHSQGRGISSLLTDASLRNQTKLDEGLEAVADTKHQTVALI